MSFVRYTTDRDDRILRMFDQVNHDIQMLRDEITELKELNINGIKLDILKNRQDIDELYEYRKRIEDYYHKNETVILFNIFKHIENARRFQQINVQ